MSIFTRNSVAALAAGILAISAAPVQAEPSVSLGSLKCDVASGFGFVFGSSRNVTCVLDRVGGEAEHYAGTIDKYGVDIGYTRHGVMVWGVLAAHKDVPQGALAGTFAGVNANATAGVGVGANLLVLGGDQNADAPKLALQPLSIEGNTGFNIAAGVATLKLAPVEKVALNK